MIAQSDTKFVIGVGIDTARYGHDVSFLREDRQPAAPSMVVTEDEAGYQLLQKQLEQLCRRHGNVHFCFRIDAAGQYAVNIERFLRRLALDKSISIGEPKRNKDYHAAMSPKRTSDRTESHAMARYAIAERPQPTPEIPDEFYAVREIVSRLQAQVKDNTRTVNQLHNLLSRVFPELAGIVNDLSAKYVLKLLSEYPTAEKIARANLESLKKIPHLKEEKAERIQAAAKGSVASLKGDTVHVLIKDAVQTLKEGAQRRKRLEKLLLEAVKRLPDSGHLHVPTIPGIGQVNAAVIIAKIIDIRRFPTVDKLVGYFGAFPHESTSGVDSRGKTIPPGTMRMSAKGADIVRGYLWNAAKSAVQCNPAVKDLYRRLRAKGKRGDVALGHCMRKLLHQIFGVWTTNRPFDVQLSQPHVSQSQHLETAVQNESPQVDRTEMAAGHKREIPPMQVVTAANVIVNEASMLPQAPSCSIDYAYLREQITLERVLERLGLMERLYGQGSERRGPCPFHASGREGSKSFTVNLDKNVFHCKNRDCQAKGNALDFWCLIHNLSLHPGAVNLADSFQLHLQRSEKRQPVSASSDKRDHFRKRQKKGVITSDAP